MSSLLCGFCSEKGHDEGRFLTFTASTFNPGTGLYGTASSTASGYAYDFTANGKPGNKYRDPPRGGSCFDKGALVLMADKSTLLPVKRLRPGDKIWSPAAKHPSLSRSSLTPPYQDDRCRR